MDKEGKVKQRKLVPTVCPYCGCGCGLYVAVEDGVAKNIEYMKEHPATRGALCPKGNAAIQLVYHTERLRSPIKKENGRWVNISWEEAIELVAARLGQIKDASGSDALGFFSSSRCTNEENYLLQKLARLLGTNNVDNCARV
jgi:predicted molibdopterin-dependent oxidoreductase YjgC